MPDKKLWLLLIVYVLALAACGTTPEPQAITQTPTTVEETVQPTEAATAAPPTLTLTPTDTPTPTLTPTVIYGPEPRAVEFQAEDGQVLQGTYYPSGKSPAPVIVLMHWARGDQGEWSAVARWLQNRGEGGSDQPGAEDWLNPAWFPEMPEDLSPAVFTFTFRGCEGGCAEYPAADWLLDARAAMDTASQLEGVDGDRVLAVGASIGADGAVDSCYWMNAAQGGTCLGAFALSPGSYLTVPYQDVVFELSAEDRARPVWCLFGKRDGGAAKTCRSGSQAQLMGWEHSDEHGLELITQAWEPSALDYLLQFLSSTLGSAN